MPVERIHFIVQFIVFYISTISTKNNDDIVVYSARRYAR